MKIGDTVEFFAPVSGALKRGFITWTDKANVAGKQITLLEVETDAHDRRLVYANKVVSVSRPVQRFTSVKDLLV